MTPLSIRALTLSHFRSHKTVRMAFDGRPVVLQGPNGAGKTNILEAVSLLSPGRGLRRASADEITRRPEALGWKILAEVEGSGRIHELETGAEAGQPRTLRIDGKACAQVALASVLRIVWLVPAQDRLWIEGAEGRRRFLDRMTMSFFPSHAEATLAYEKAMRERNRLLKDQIRDPMWYRAIEEQMAKQAAAIIANRAAAVDRLRRSMEDTDTQFPIAEIKLQEVDEGVGIQSSEGFSAAFETDRSRDMAAGRTLIGPHRTDLIARYAAKDVEARLCSTGEQKALLISLVLANARALKADLGTAPLVLLDEVAAHLDADRRAALFDEICALKAQAWLTGTGPELFAELGPRAQHFAVSDINRSSAVTEITP